MYASEEKGSRKKLISERDEPRDAESCSQIESKMLPNCNVIQWDDSWNAARLIIQCSVIWKHLDGLLRKLRDVTDYYDKPIICISGFMK